MKRNILAAIAVALTIAFSAFTTPRFANVYLEYDSGVHSSLSSYDVAGTLNPETGDALLIWIKIVDVSGTITDDEFAAAFDVLDRSNPANTSLNDATDTEGTFGNYQLERSN